MFLYIGLAIPHSFLRRFRGTWPETHGLWYPNIFGFPAKLPFNSRRAENHAVGSNLQPEYYAFNQILHTHKHISIHTHTYI